jgi:hypothetical protein
MSKNFSISAPSGTAVPQEGETPRTAVPGSASASKSSCRVTGAALRERRAALLAQAEELAEFGFTKAAEQTLLRAFYTYALSEGGAYDLIAELHTGLGQDGDAHRWEGMVGQAERARG